MLFSQDIHAYTQSSQRALRDFVTELPCDGLANMSEGYVSAHFAERHLLQEPQFNAEPVSKDLESDGETAVYVHMVTNPSSLRFKPSQFTFGGWPCRMELDGDRLIIRIPASASPPAKTRHAAIVTQLQGNIAALAQDIARHNRSLTAGIEPLLAQRRQRCDEIAARRAAL